MLEIVDRAVVPREPPWLSEGLACYLETLRLDFSDRIPDDARTMVVVPTMLTSTAGVAALLDKDVTITTTLGANHKRRRPRRNNTLRRHQRRVRH